MTHSWPPLQALWLIAGSLAPWPLAISLAHFWFHGSLTGTLLAPWLILVPWLPHLLLPLNGFLAVPRSLAHSGSMAPSLVAAPAYPHWLPDPGCPPLAPCSLPDPLSLTSFVTSCHTGFVACWFMAPHLLLALTGFLALWPLCWLHGPLAPHWLPGNLAPCWLPAGFPLPWPLYWLPGSMAPRSLSGSLAPAGSMALAGWYQFPGPQSIPGYLAHHWLHVSLAPHWLPGLLAPCWLPVPRHLAGFPVPCPCTGFPAP